jgi:membrane-associated phospholipid phosphatase
MFFFCFDCKLGIMSNLKFLKRNLYDHIKFAKIMKKYLVTSILLFIGFSIITSLIITDNKQVEEWDLSGFYKINGSHIKILNKIMVSFSEYGREVVWGSIILILLIFGKTNGRKVAVLLIVTFLILIPSTYLLKDEIDRPRPAPLLPDNLLLKSPQGEPSFPSGHSVIVSAGACIMLLRYNNQAKKIILSLLLTAEAILVMYSMIYVGAHYPLDVVAGITLGISVSLVVIYHNKYMTPIFSFVESIERKRKD